jgi:hypothetical protein
MSELKYDHACEDMLKNELRDCESFMLEQVDADAANDVRYARWDTQSSDGKKHQDKLAPGERVFPFEGASDTRVLLCDQIISDLTDLCCTSLARASLRVTATEMNDLAIASASETLLSYFRKKMQSHILSEAELVSSYAHTYGFALVQVSWEQETSLRNQKLTMQQISEFAAQSQDGMAAELPALIGDKVNDDLVSEVLMGVFPVEREDAKAAVKSLRETGEASFPVPYLCRNAPAISALAPYDDILFPEDTVDLQSARVIFRRVWLTEEAVMAHVNDDGWDEDWAEELIAKARGVSMNADEKSTQSTEAGDPSRHEELFEVFYAYSRRLNDEDIPAVYVTIFSPHIEGSAKHELLDYSHNQYPFVAYSAERVSRRLIDSRGVPHVVRTWQNEAKAQRDSIQDYTSLSTLPPYEYLKRNGPPPALGAGQGVPVTKIGDVAFMSLPTREPSTAFQVVRGIEKMANQYFGLHDPEVPPTATQMKAQRRMNNWLSFWSDVFAQMLSLCAEYLSKEEVLRITNTPLELTTDINRYDVSLSFNVQELDSNLVQKRLETIMSVVVPLDVTGRLDRASLVEFILRSVAPESADQLLVDQASASQQLYSQVKQDIVGMSVGFNPQLTDASNDPTAETKLQYAQELVSSNQQLMQRIGGDEQVKSLFEAYFKNLQMGVSQQRNKQIGRYGVDPSGGTQA